MSHKYTSLPMILTYSRLIAAPLVLPFLFVYLLPFNIFWINATLALLFFLFGLTDFFDGYLARKFDQVSSQGALLDHVADKFLLYSTLIALVSTHKLYFFWALLWIGREFFIMSIRQVALENNFILSVSILGKLKTVIQIICLTVVILNPEQEQSLFTSYWNQIEMLLLICATALSLISLYDYLCSFFDKFKNR